ncbi:MAG TPA: Nramp family divalent metal transporter [Vicinamibacteria bacterium]|nr:Nramp family divalent metal transporter [Vicinamibacteria bacterium]
MRLVTALRGLGPGIIMAATAIGTSHIILSPVAGARFGYELIWLVLFSHFFKYPAFEFGPRFAVARGVSLVKGFQEVPGPKNWAVWVFLVTTVLQGLTILAGILSVTAAILLAWVGGLSLSGFVVVLGLVIIVLHRTGKYPALALGSKIAMLVLALVSIVAFLAVPPGASDLVRIFVPSFPAGSLVLVGSILGLMPTGINVAIWHSLWAVEHLPIWRKVAGSKDEILKLGMFDLNVGYLLSAVLAVVFVSLGANLLKPRGLYPDGVEVALTLSRLYTDVLGAWMFPVFMLAAFAAMFSTAYSVMDAFPRTFSRILSTLFPRSPILQKEGDPAYTLFLAVIFLFAIGANRLLPNPVLMVQLVGLVSLSVAPVLYALNYYCVTRLIDDPSMRPSRGLRLWALSGLLFMLVAVIVSVYARFH